jgi:hypothetical protein
MDTHGRSSQARPGIGPAWGSVNLASGRRGHLHRKDLATEAYPSHNIGVRRSVEAMRRGNYL